MSPKRKYDSTVARIAGNIASGLMQTPAGGSADEAVGRIARTSVYLARAIVAEVERTEPKLEDQP